MKVGVSTSISAESYDVALLAKRAEELGFESFFVPEHTIMPLNISTRYHGTSDGSIPEYMTYMVDPLITLARASAATEKIMLGTGVLLVPEHNPILLGKEVATLDYLSGGRFIFGIGAGWMREEAEIMGSVFDHRWGQTRECIQVMKELWTKDEAQFHGKYFDFPLVRCNPKPAQKPHPPVLIGSVSSKVFRRIISWADGWMPTRATPDDIKRGKATMEELATAAGRDPDSIKITVWAGDNLEARQTYADVGAERMVFRLSNNKGEESLKDLEVLAQRVLG